MLADDHPAKTIPYTAIEAIAKMYNKPTFKSLIPSRIVLPNISTSGPTGITATITSAGIIVNIGAKKNNVLSAPAGVNSSLNMSLIPSAAGCNKPQGPTRLGPLRTCIRAAILRSAKVKYANAVSNTNATSTLFINASIIIDNILVY